MADAKDLATKYIPAGSIYTIIVGTLYLWGYWTTFRIDVLEYIALTDIFKAAALPILVVCVSFAAGASLSHLQRARRPQTSSISNEINIEDLLKRRRRAGAILVVGAAAWAVFTIAAFMTISSIGWMMLMMATIIPLARIVDGLGLLEDLLTDPKARQLFLLILVSFPGLAFAVGKINAQIVESGQIFDYVTLPADGDGVPDETAILKRQRFIGHASDFFLWNPSNQALTISKFDARTPLVVMRFGKKLSPPHWFTQSFMKGEPAIAARVNAINTVRSSASAPLAVSAPSKSTAR